MAHLRFGTDNRYMRLFVAAELPEPVTSHLASALAPLMPEGTRALTPVENWHLTLAFYGEVPEGSAGELAGAVARSTGILSAPVVHLSGSGWFRHTTAWIGVGGQVEKLTAVMTTLEDLGPREPPATSHRPHLTIARTGRRTRGRVPALDQVITALSVYRGPEWTIEEVVLMCSELGQGRFFRTK